MKIELKNNRKPISKIALTCKLLSLLCLGASIILAAWGIIAFCLMCFSLVHSLQGSEGNATAFVYPIASLSYMVVSSFIPMILWRMLSEISDARTPFVLKNANRLRLIALLFLLYDGLAFIMDITSSQFLLQTGQGPLEIGGAISDFASSGATTFDLFPLVIAAVFFALSYVFKYGVLLQQESDETL